MLRGAFEGSEIELRASPKGGRVVTGRFPYNRKAVLSDGGRNGGRPKKEQFAPGAFKYSLTNPDAPDIHLLSGHDFSRPLASRSNGTLKFSDSTEALSFTAEIVPEVAATSYASDLFALILAGLAVGVSPGFRIPPPRAVAPEDAERIDEEPMNPSKGMHGAIIRTILAAILFELSIVVRPAYEETQVDVESRSWKPTRGGVLRPDATLRRALSKWRA